MSTPATVALSAFLVSERWRARRHSFRWLTLGWICAVCRIAGTHKANLPYRPTFDSHLVLNPTMKAGDMLIFTCVQHQSLTQPLTHPIRKEFFLCWFARVRTQIHNTYCCYMQGGTHTRHMQLERRHTQTPSPALQVSLRLKNNMIAVRVGEPQVLATSESHSDRTALTHVLNVYMMCASVCMTGQADIHLATLPGETLRI